ncbi:MAG: 4-hydroxythreonine-4-phosphate dehydrogenase PdxA [Ignavibacteriae bacterium]|nr:4-hydroxythreonine-4-phosphate dehydrogenase PdxA [Ignavibacteriota bacterium]
MKSKPIVGITMGDYNGIGPEVAIKAAISLQVQSICHPVLFGLIDVFEYYARLLKMNILLREIDEQNFSFQKKGIPVFHLSQYQISGIQLGKVTEEAGLYACLSLEKAVEYCSDKILHGMVTAPVSKDSMNKAGYCYPGQTEMLAFLTRTNKFMMMVTAGSFRVGLATIHLPLKCVPEAISKKIISEKLILLKQSLKKDFGIDSPKIAVLGLNPHAGEDGLLGYEEIDFIIPSLEYVRRRKGVNVEGPFPADGFFGRHLYRNYDAVLAMYHDQGLIPLKMQGFDIGVNFTAGLPIVRTSPDHGTAFDIAGKGIANPSSMIEAIKLAVSIIHNRKKKQ